MRPLIINNHEKTEDVYLESIEYLKANDLLFNDIGNFIWAYYQISDLIPQTVDNFWSGHYFPFSESYYELENSYQFCLQGFYRHSLTTLRTVLELCVIGLYFNKDGQGHVDIQDWIHSNDRTPSIQKCIDEIFMEEYYQRADEIFSLSSEVRNLYDTLSGFVHVRGYQHSSSGRSRSNFNTFNTNALNEYISFLKQLIIDVIVMILLKYPVGMQDLPLMEKFYLNSPAGGFLDESSRLAVFSVLNDEYKRFLTQISDNDPTVQEIVKWVNDLPDLTEEELQRQNEEHDRWINEHREKNEDI